MNPLRPTTSVSASRRIATMILLLLTALPRTAGARPPAAPATTTTRCENLDPVPLAGALFTIHRPDRAKGTIQWESRFIVESDASFDFKGGTIRFAVPLPEGESLSPTAGLTPFFEAGRMIGLCVSPETIRDRTIAADFSQPVEGTSAHPLGVPVVKGSTVQIVDTVSSIDARIEITTPGFERNVGFVAPPGVSHGAREEARRLTATRARLTANPIFVRGDDLERTGSLEGRIVDERQRARGSAFGVGLVFAGVVASLVLAARRLKKSAHIEHADAVLASAIEESAAQPARRVGRP
jgi:hypothetical protein